MLHKNRKRTSYNHNVLTTLRPARISDISIVWRNSYVQDTPTHIACLDSRVRFKSTVMCAKHMQLFICKDLHMILNMNGQLTIYREVRKLHIAMNPIAIHVPCTDFSHKITHDKCKRFNLP